MRKIDGVRVTETRTRIWGECDAKSPPRIHRETDTFLCFRAEDIATIREAVPWEHAHGDKIEVSIADCDTVPEGYVEYRDAICVDDLYEPQEAELRLPATTPGQKCKPLPF